MTATFDPPHTANGHHHGTAGGFGPDGADRDRYGRPVQVFNLRYLPGFERVRGNRALAPEQIGDAIACDAEQPRPDFFQRLQLAVGDDELVEHVLQYVFGKLFGRHRFSPRISPSKTIEGLLGGGLSAIAIGALLYPLTPFTPLQSAGMAAIVVVAGFFGGFVLSAVKRDLAVKDWGTLIEGHGGVLDRVDSIIFSAPLLFHLTRYWFTS